MTQLAVAFLAGLLFAVGLIVSGMSNPAKVLNFLDIAGTWDPTLAVVMGGALLVTFPTFGWVLSRSAPLLCEQFQLPTRTRIDVQLLLGSAIFGLGWGLAGLCPGPALTSLATTAKPVVMFVAAMIAGMLACRYLVEPLFTGSRRTCEERTTLREQP